MSIKLNPRSSLRNLNRYFVLSVLVASIIAIPFVARPVQAAPPPDFESTTFLSGIHDPTTFKFAPDGSIYIAEKAGAIRHYAGGVLTTLITVPTPTDYERGLLGLELDANFTINHYLYASYTNSDGFSRLSRFTVTGETIDPASEFVFLKLNQPSDIYHNGNDVHIGPDGKVWWSVGDGQVPANAQSLQSGHGKMLRFDTDGTSANDNPWHGDGSKIDQIYALGFRNPFRFTFLPNGKAIVGDVGLDSYEELDVIENGGNYGWPQYEGACGSCGYVNPVFQYAHNGQNSSISAVATYTGSTFGPEYKNAVFYGDYARGTLRYLKFDASYSSVLSDNAFEPAAGTIVDIQTGPDGNLYYASIFSGTITKVAPSGGNRAPIAQATGTPTAGLAPLDVAFSSAGSNDPEGVPLTYNWIFGDGATSTVANPNHIFTVNGTYTVTLTVSDGVKTAQAFTPVTVGNRLPTPVITTPITGTKYNAGDTISYAGTATDPEDGDLPASAYSWQIVLHHSEHIHPYLGPIIGVKAGSFTIDRGTNNEATTWYSIELTVTDSGGLKTLTTRAVNPNLSTMTIQSAIPGAQFTVDGRLFTGQYISPEVVGVEHGLSVPSPQTISGQNYRFLSWSDGGAQTHVYRVPAANATVTSSVFQTFPVPSPWTDADIGLPKNAGKADYDTTRQAFLVDGGGNDIWGTTDQFHYVSQPLSGDGEVITRVTSQTAADPWTKSGVMIKESATAGSPYVMIAVTPANGIVMQYGFNGDINPKPAFAFPVWLKLKRTGNVFTGSYSPNGTTWTQVGQATLPMSTSATSGMFVTAHTDISLSTTAFDNTSVTSLAPVPNTAPVAANGSVATTKDTPLTVPLTATDAQGDPLTYAVVAVPLHGALTGTGSSRTYTPAAGYSGPDSFTFKANDGLADSNVATVSITVTPAMGPLPASWLDLDVGTVTPQVGKAGFDSTSQTFTVAGGGYDIWYDRDDFHYAYQQLAGDGEISARITSQTRTDPYAKAGVMIKQSTAPFAPYALVGLTPDSGNQFQWSFLKESESSLSNAAPNNWVKLKRAGNVFTAYKSMDGITWVQFGTSHTITMTTGATIGLFSASHNAGAISTATFDNVKIVTPQLNSAPVAQNKTISVQPGTATPVVLTATDANNDPLTYALLTQPSHGTLTGTAPNLTYTPASGYNGPDTFTYRASDGQAISNVATVSITVAALPSPWLQKDVGTVTPSAGSGIYNATSKVFTVAGGGYDIWDNRDDFHYVYQSLNGDGQITARVTSQTNTDGSAKAGVMIKDSTTPFAPYALLGITPSNGYRFQWTFLKQSTSGGTFTLPNAWVRLTRVGNVISSYKSANGTSWILIGQKTVTMNATATIGLFVTSHNSGALSTATFDNVTVIP